jgi:energy-converting hydrogenase Eha subunit E
MRWLAMFQAAYFVVTGIWPIVHIGSFMAVTGPKRDLWLVRTVGVLIVAIGASIGLAGVRNTIGLETFVLAVSAALGLIIIDVVYTLKRTISPIYLADAVVEFAIVVTWLVFRFTR